MIKTQTYLDHCGFIGEYLYSGGNMAREKAFLDTKIIIDKAICLIENEGFEHFTTRKLSVALGTSVMTLYNYFENRKAILREAILAAFELLWEGLPERLEPYFEGKNGSPLRAFLAIGDHLRDFAKKRPRLYVFLFRANIVPFQREERIVERYSYTFRRVLPFLTDSAKANELHRRVFLFEILANNLVLNALQGRGNLNEKIITELIAEAYDGLLSPYEAIVPPPREP